MNAKECAALQKSEWRIAANGRMDLSSERKQRRWRTRQKICGRLGRQVKSDDSRRAGCGWESRGSGAIARNCLLALFSKQPRNQYAQRQLMILAARWKKNLVDCLCRVGRTSASPSSLALFARPAPPAGGLDRLSLARQGLAKQVRQGGREVAPTATQMKGVA